MGMPVTVCIRDEGSGERDVSAVVSWFENVNHRFSTCLESSEVCRLNAGAIVRNDVSSQLEEVLLLCEQTNVETGGDGYSDGQEEISGSSPTDPFCNPYGCG
jgi:thiamine biosynthesis lipoprotein